MPGDRPAVGRAAVLGVALALGGAWHAVLILVFLVAVLWADEIAHASARALSAALGAARERAQQRRELDRRWLELGRPSRPVPSAHEYPEDVRDLAGTLVARLCPECEAQLPPDFEVLKGTNDAGPRPRRGGPGGRPAGTGLAAKEESAREARRARAPRRQRRDGWSTPRGRTANFVPGAGLGWPVVLRDADGYPFAVGTIDGQVIIQVAATAPRGTVRLSAEHASGLALKLIEAAARVMRADPAALLMFEGGRRYELRATLAYDRKEPYEVRLLFPPGLEHLDLVLARELLDQGLIGPATFGGIRVWPVHGGRWTVCIGLVTPAGDTRFEAPATTVQEAGGARPGQGAGRGGAPGASDRGGSAQGRSPNGHPPSPPPPPRPQ